MMYTNPAKSKIIIGSNYRAMKGPLMDQGRVLTLVSLESIVFLLLRIQQVRGTDRCVDADIES